MQDTAFISTTLVAIKVTSRIRPQDKPYHNNKKMERKAISDQILIESSSKLTINQLDLRIF